MGQTRSGRRFPTKRYKEFKQQVLDIVNKKNIRLTGFIRPTVKLVVPDKRKRDIANINKCLMDALESSDIFGNDYYLEDLNEGRLRDKDSYICMNKNGGWVEVTLEELPYHDNFVEVEDKPLGWIE